MAGAQSVGNHIMYGKPKVSPQRPREPAPSRLGACSFSFLHANVQGMSASPSGTYTLATLPLCAQGQMGAGHLGSQLGRGDGEQPAPTPGSVVRSGGQRDQVGWHTGLGAAGAAGGRTCRINVEVV